MARLLFACTVIVAVLVIALGARRMAQAQSQASSAQSAFDLISHNAQEIFDLRGRQQTVELRERPQQDVIAQVNSVLAEVGIPSRNLRSLAPEADAQVASGVAGNQAKLKRQSLRLVLENLTVQEIGAFLLKWRSVQQIWTVTRIEMAHVRDKDSEDGRYDATLVISALYVEDAPGTAPRTIATPDPAPGGVK